MPPGLPPDPLGHDAPGKAGHPAAVSIARPAVPVNDFSAAQPAAACSCRSTSSRALSSAAAAGLSSDEADHTTGTPALSSTAGASLDARFSCSCLGSRVHLAGTVSARVAIH